jgi:multidrug efflux pump
MRRTLGTGVFSGMIGVTLFGIFLTPVFYYVLQGLSERLGGHKHPPGHRPEQAAAEWTPAEHEMAR